MAKKRENAPPAAAGPTWRDYGPSHPWYWWLGGPFIPPEEIPAAAFEPGSIGGGMKPAARARWAAECLRQTEAGLAEDIAKYLDLKARGMKALSPYTRESWEHRVHVGEVKSDTLDPVSEALCAHHNHIRYDKGRIVACKAAIAEVDHLRSPLFPD